jgi:hypothetical protein
MKEPGVYKGVYEGSSRRQLVTWQCIAAGVRDLLGGAMQLASLVVALSVAASGVAVLVWIVDSGWPPGFATLALVLLGVAALTAAPIGLYRNKGVRRAAVFSAVLLGGVVAIDLLWAFLSVQLEWAGGEPNVFPWWVATLVLLVALSGAAILVYKTQRGRKLHWSRRSDDEGK